MPRRTGRTPRRGRQVERRPDPNFKQSRKKKHAKIQARILFKQAIKQSLQEGLPYDGDGPLAETLALAEEYCQFENS